MNECTLSAHNANRQVGTPEDLSCFTPSPIASSPNAPSPVPLHFRSPNLSRSSIVPPSERILFVPSHLLLFHEAPDHEVDRIYCTLITPPAASPALGCGVFLTVDDIIKAATFYKMERFESNLSHCPTLHSFLTRFLSGSIERAHERTTLSWLLRAAFFVLGLFHKIFELKSASTESATEKFPCSLRINHITTSSDVRGGANRFEISVTALGHQIVVSFPDLTMEYLEQMHNPRVRRSESCESIRSFDSFLSDPVVDWKDLLYGYNREAASKEREF